MTTITDRLAEALRRVLAWSSQVAGDNVDNDAAVEELAALDQAIAALSAYEEQKAEALAKVWND